jgi:hypothetical protein|tara:strand:+ start:1574 stop:2260 length:687 start_codon:yes stop_codon:yes gene_type:complete
MKTNIYQKLHKASSEAGGVVKGNKVPGMHFNPLQHDEVSKVAMRALLNNELYPICTYENDLKENFVMVYCNMKIFDITDPTSFVEINGCSAMGKLDKFGTGNGMSYAKKYAFLNALNLKTGLDNDDGKDAVPFEAILEIAKDSVKPKAVKQDTKTLADSWISQLKTAASVSKSQNNFENNLEPIRAEYKSELQAIQLDPIESMRVETIYNKLKSQIQTNQIKRTNNGR